MDRALWYLKSCELFERLSDAEAARLNRRGLLRRYPARAPVSAPTEPGRSLLVLASGRVKIKDVTPDGHETILAFIEPGEAFGELALLDGQRRQEYAETVAASEVLLLPREDVMEVLETRVDLVLSVTKLIGLRRQRIESRLRNLLFLSSRDRVVRMLLELVETHGEGAGNRRTFRLPLSHQDLASLIGVTRETATLTLGQLQAEGLVDVQRRRLAVADLEGLRRAAGQEAGRPAARR